MYIYANSGTNSEYEYTYSDNDILLVPTVLNLSTVDQFLEVNKVYEDYSIEWRHMKTIENFNESQCIPHHFRFKKVDIFETKRALRSRFREYLTRTINYLQVTNGYWCILDTALLIILFHFFRQFCFWPESEAFFGMRCSHLFSTLTNITYAFVWLAGKNLRVPTFFTVERRTMLRKMTICMI